MVLGVTTTGYIVLTVFLLIVLAGLFEAVRLFWRLMRGDEQIEGTSWGRQYAGRRRREHLNGE